MVSFYRTCNCGLWHLYPFLYGLLAFHAHFMHCSCINHLYNANDSRKQSTPVYSIFVCTCVDNYTAYIYSYTRRRILH